METPRYTLPPEQRLKSRTQIDLLFGEGERGFAFPIRYLVRVERLEPLPAAGSTQAGRKKGRSIPQPETVVMVSVPKRLHKRANVRNLLKRRMREAYRLNKEPLREICIRENIRLSLGLLYTSGEIADYKTIEHAVRKIIKTVVARS